MDINVFLRNRITGIIFCLIVVLSARGQGDKQFSGKITDNRMFPIQGAAIHLLNTNRGTLSDSGGNFIFKELIAGNYSLQISALGYAALNSEIVIGKTPNESFIFILTENSIQLDGVFVNAQKKEEFLQKVPIGISALSTREVKDYRLWNSKDLTAIVPNLYAANPGDERNVTSVRGITTTSYDPAVTTYIDGVNQFSLDTYIPQLWDIERIEVLRGPQGTLYGRNAMGGVINIITKQPGNKRNGFFETSSGNYGLTRISAGIQGPLVKKKLFLGIASLYNKRNGYYENDYYQDSFDDQHAIAGNYFLKWSPGSRLFITLNVKHNNNRNHGAFTLVNGVDDALSNPFHLNQDAVAKMIDNTINISLVGVYTGKRFDFSSQTAFQHNRRFYDKPLDADFSPIDGITIINDYGDDWNKNGVWTQEFKFNSPSASGGKLKWTAGSYFFSQDNPTKQAVHFGKDAAWVGAPDINFSIINSTKAKSWGVALFGQVTYELTGKMKIITGIRYDYEKKKYNILGEYQKDPNPVPLFDTRPDTSASINFNALSPKLGLTYNLGISSDVFVTYSRGFRTGGLTPLSSDPSQPPLYPFKPEYSNTIEAGIKNNLLKNKLQLNLTLFIAHVNDAQVPTLLLPDAVTVTKNAGKLTSKGIELELASTPFKGLKVDYNFGYTDADYKDLKLSQNGSAVNLDGKKQIFTPEATSMFVLQYAYGLPVKRQLKLVARFEWMYLGGQYFDLANTIKQKGYSLLNTRFGISLKQTSLMFWVRNLGNKKYIAYAYDFGAVHLGDPKTIGITFSTAF